MAFYNCPKRLRTGETCNRRCYDPNGCYVHRNSPMWYQCPKCGKWTYLSYGYCDADAKIYRSRASYNRKRLEQMNQKIVEAKEKEG